MVVPVIWLALIGVIYSQIASFFALNHIFSSANESDRRKMKDMEYHVANFATFVSKTLTFSSQKVDEFNFKPAQYCINKIFELTKSCIWAISIWM